MNKRTKVVSTFLAVCVGIILLGTKAYATTGKTTNDTTRIRKKTSTSSEIVEVISRKGEKIEILEEEGEWYKVKYQTSKGPVVGYIRNDLVEVEKDTKTESSKSDKSETKSEEKSESKTSNEEKSEENSENKTSSDEEKTEQKSENKTSSEEENEQNSDEQTSKEQNVDIIEIKENAQIQLKSDTEIKLLPIIYSCNTGKISANTSVNVTEVVGNWARIEDEENEGWVLISKIANSQAQTSKVETETNSDDQEENNSNKEDKKEDVKAEESKTEKLYVNTVTLNLREKADKSAKIITQLNQNDEVTVVKVVDSTWTQVKYKQYEGYTASEYLSNKKVSTVTSRGSDEIRGTDAAKKKAEEEAAKKKAEEEVATKKKAEEEAAAKKKAEQEAAAKKKAEEEAAAKKKAEQEAAAKKKAEQEAAAKKKAEQEAAKKKAEEEAAKKKSTTSSKTTTSTKSTSSKSKVTGSDIIAYAKKYLGCKYVYGATGPKTFDCSGFTQYVYKHFGYSIPRTSGDQRNIKGAKIIKSKSDLQIGDIICFPGHVGLYVGNGNFIHASHTGSDVKISSLSSSYYKNKFIQGTRVLK